MRRFHTLLYPLLGLLCLSCSDDEQETGSNPALNSGAITFGVDLTGFTTRITQDGTSWTNGDKIVLRPNRMFMIKRVIPISH